MTPLMIDEHLAAQLESIAAQEGRSVNEVLATLLSGYTPEHAPAHDALDAFIGMLDSDITDLSTTMREKMHDYWKKRSGKPDTD